MQINRITDTQFKGAYFVIGQGIKVKEAEEKIEKELNGEGQITRLGHGFETYDLPAYLLVTTGDDVKKYNDFAARKQRACYNEIAAVTPEKTRDDFEKGYDFIRYQIIREGVITVDAIRENCDFEEEPYILQADGVIASINDGEFDAMSGETA